MRCNNNLDVYKGTIYENIEAESLIKQGLDLYYYSKDDSSLEIDFFVQDTTHLIPLEVKASNNQTKSMASLINDDRYSDISFDIKLFVGNIGKTDKVISFPYFCTFLLKRCLKTLK